MHIHRKVLLVGDIDDMNDEECSSEKKIPKFPLVKVAADVHEENTKNDKKVTDPKSPPLEPWLDFGLNY